jgi:hypothetical protein
VQDALLSGDQVPKLVAAPHEPVCRRSVEDGDGEVLVSGEHLETFGVLLSKLNGAPGLSGGRSGCVGEILNAGNATLRMSLRYE